MKQYILLLCFIIIAISIYAIAKKNTMQSNPHDTFIEKSPFADIGLAPFDRARFEKEKDGDVLEYTLDDGIEVRAFMGSGNEYYVEWREKPGSHFRVAREFYLEAGAVKRITHEWFGNSVGITTEYDPTGQIVKEVDNDAPYPFSYTDVIQLLKERGVDVWNPSFGEDSFFGLSMSRTTNPSPQYIVSYPARDPGMRHVIIVDGVTGAIVVENDESIKDKNGIE